MPKHEFTNPGNKLPPLVHAIASERGFDSMQPGEETWIVPWSVRVDSEGLVSISAGMIDRDQKPGGTVALKLVKDFDGLYIDATALSQEALGRYFEPGDHPLEEETQIIGVMYPLVSDTRGLEPEQVERFNQEQRESQKQFTQYIKNTYHIDYRFAWQDYPGFRSFADIHRELSG